MSNPIVDSLIWDRTIDDVTYLQNLMARINAGTATADEIDEFVNTSLKGGYDYSDMNRLSHAINYIGLGMDALGYPDADYNLSTNWTDKDFSAEGSDLETILVSINDIADQNGLYITIPTRWNNIDYERANLIERILRAAADNVFEGGYPYPYDLATESDDDLLAEDGETLTTEE